MALDSMDAGEYIISGAMVRHSVLFSEVVAHSYAYVEDSVIFPDVEVGRNCQVHRAIIDRGCRLPDGMKIGVDLEEDAPRFYVSQDGVVLVKPEMLKMV